MRFLVDENLPRSLARELRERGLEVSDVRDLGLRGQPDPEILRVSLALNAILITEDVEFGSKVWAEGGGPGVVLVRLPSEMPARELTELVVKVLVELGSQVERSMVVIGPHRYRIRRLPANSP